MNCVYPLVELYPSRKKMIRCQLPLFQPETGCRRGPSADFFLKNLSSDSSTISRHHAVFNNLCKFRPVRYLAFAHLLDRLLFLKLFLQSNDEPYFFLTWLKCLHHRSFLLSISPRPVVFLSLQSSCSPFSYLRSLRLSLDSNS